MDNITSIPKSRYMYCKTRSGIQKNIYYYDAELARAFQSDCEDFLQKFKQCKNFSFATFTQLWKKTNFLLIFKDIEYILMLQAFIENCFFIIKKFLFSNDHYVQTGAVYILYGLYYKQPVKEWVKIRLTLAEAEKLNEIVEYHRMNNCFDIIFIYNKMRLDEAFHYCALSQSLGLEARFLRRVDLSNEDIHIKNSNDCVLTKFKNLMEDEPDLVNFEETDGEYQKLAQKYKEKYGNLFIFPSKIGDNLKRAYSQVFDVNLEEKESDEDHLKQTKGRAMSNLHATYRGERKVVTAADLQMASTSK